MKRRNVSLILLIVSLLFALAACESSDKVSKDTILADMDAANTREALSENNERIAYRAKFFDESGEESATAYTYLDQEKYIYEEDVYLNVDKSGEVTYYYSDDQHRGMCLFIGEKAYSEDLPNWPMSWYTYDPTEKVTEISEEDGMLFIATEISDKDYIGSFEDWSEDESDNIKKAIMEYVIDPQSYEIQKLEAFLEYRSGAKKLYSQVIKEKTTEEYLLPSHFVETMSNGEKRTVTIIENPGTGNETKYEYQVPCGVDWDYVLSGEYEQKLYADPAFTTKFKNDGDLTSDAVAYIRK